jgi:hypothetical protein
MTKITIGKVDMYGLCGRDPHPKETDCGKTGRLVGYSEEDFGVELKDKTVMGFFKVKIGKRTLDFAEYEIAKIETGIES